MKTLKITIKFENILIILTQYYHLKYINLKISIHNRNRGYKIDITAFTTATTIL